MNESDTITEDALKEAGWNVIHWNPNWHGGFFEYWVQVSERNESMLSVRFDADPRYERPFMAYLKAGEFMQVSIALWNVTTMRDLLMLYQIMGAAHD